MAGIILLFSATDDISSSLFLQNWFVTLKISNLLKFLLLVVTKNRNLEQILPRKFYQNDNFS